MKACILLLEVATYNAMTLLEYMHVRNTRCGFGPYAHFANNNPAVGGCVWAFGMTKLLRQQSYSDVSLANRDRNSLLSPSSALVCISTEIAVAWPLF